MGKREECPNSTRSDFAPFGLFASVTGLPADSGAGTFHSTPPAVVDLLCGPRLVEPRGEEASHGTSE
jgi:hypothetical protein